MLPSAERLLSTKQHFKVVQTSLRAALMNTHSSWKRISTQWISTELPFTVMPRSCNRVSTTQDSLLAQCSVQVLTSRTRVFTSLLFSELVDFCLESISAERNLMLRRPLIDAVFRQRQYLKTSVFIAPLILMKLYSSRRSLSLELNFLITLNFMELFLIPGMRLR